jgi:hypothetical protein
MCQACKEEGMASSIIRGKGVSHGNMLVNSDEDGNVTVQQGMSLDPAFGLKLTEAEALALYENLGNMIEWKSEPAAIVATA